MRLVCAVLILVIGSASFNGIEARNELALEVGLPEETNVALIQDFLQNRELIGEWILSINDNGYDRAARIPSLTCTACRAAVGLGLNLIHQGAELEELAVAVTNICISLHIASETICRGVIDHYLPAVVFIFHERSFINTNDVCGILFQDGDCGTPNATFTDWDISIDGNKPPVRERPALPSNAPTSPILQLTDIHMDLEYVEGSFSNCVGIMCCWEPLPENSSTAEPAGHFGSYLCDFPQSSVDNLFENAAARYNYSFVLLTGDYVHHGIWATSIPGNMRHNTAVAKSIGRLFKTTPVFPVVGNHEGHPCNMYAPRSVWDTPGQEFDLSWLFNQISDLYSQYLPAEAIQSFRNYGYYTASPSPGFRLVVLNTNLCYVFNFWIFYDSADPENQLQWFADTMLEAERAGETVYVVGHVPPGHHHCWSPWAEKFNRIINRFENIIQAQFYGHTHQDDLKIFFEGPAEVSGPGPRPTSSLYIGASATTYTNLNPGYKVYHVDGAGAGSSQTWEILDHETWIYNLTLANVPGHQPDWFKLYTARSAYSLESLRPADLYDLVVRMVNDDDLFQLWYMHYHKAAGGRSREVQAACEDSKCRLSYLCDAVTTDIGDQSHCERLRALLEDIGFP